MMDRDEILIELDGTMVTLERFYGRPPKWVRWIAAHEESIITIACTAIVASLAVAAAIIQWG